MAYAPVRDSTFAGWQEDFRRARFLEDVADWMNGWIRLPTDVTLTTGSLNLRYALLAKEPCVTVMPHSLLPFAQHGKSVRVLPIELPPWDIATMVITLKDRTVGPIAARFLERVRAMSRPLA